MKLERGSNFTREEMDICKNYIAYALDHGPEIIDFKVEPELLFMEFIDGCTKYGLTYDEQHALQSYFSSSSYIINEALYKNLDITKYKDLIVNLDNALDKLPSIESIVYRSIDIEHNSEILNEILSVFNNEEKIGSWNNYLSCSEGIYNTDARLQLVIKAKSAKKVFDNKFESGFEELIIPRNTKFTYDDYDIVKVNDIETMVVYISEVE